MTMANSRNERRMLEKENMKWPARLVQVPSSQWPGIPMPKLVEVWRSRGFLVQVFNEEAGIQRLTICRTSHDGDRWHDGITWDELQMLKRECGRGGKDAVEVYPADQDVVNVANMRHLWVLPERLPFAWRR